MTLARRAYGNTGIELSIIGFGGIIVSGMEQASADRCVAQAVERGVNYFDIAPSYGDAEHQLGPALEPYRQDVFLACKTTHRDAAGARAELEQSLATLRTDYFDLYQLHALTKIDKDVDAAFAADGIMPMLIEEKRAGRIRHIGFSAHSTQAAMAAMERYDFDSILFPINFATYYESDFGPQVIPRAQQIGAARLALKAMAKGKWQEGDPRRAQYKNCWYEPLFDRELASLALRFTLSQPITAALPPGAEDLFWTAMDIAEDFKPLEEGEYEQLRAMARQVEPIFSAAGGFE